MAEIQIRSSDCDDEDEDCCERGKRGKRGHDGATGPTGPTGSTGAAGATGATGAAAAGVALNAAMFFGQTTGTGSTENDYAATIAVGAPIPFPQNGPATAGSPVSRASSSTFTLANTGIYEVSWQLGSDQDTQIQVAVVTGGPTFTPIANTTSLSGAGTQMNSATVLISATAGTVIALINPAGNSTAFDVQPANGALTHAQAASVVIKQVG
jgi:hypothetical protein